jgi:hypothetical protein
MNDWVCVYTFNREYQSRLALEMLLDNDIEAALMNKKDSLYQIGDIELYVHPEQVIRAKILLNEFEK